MRPLGKRTVETDDGVELATQVLGSGPALVLCHGGPGLWNNLDDLAGLLAQASQVWTYDQRGCGRSSGIGPYTVARFVADLDAVRVATDAERILVGGHSWGAVLALLYAAAHPERVGGVLYVAGVGVEWTKWRPLFREAFQRRAGGPPFATLAATEPENVIRWAIDFAEPDVGLGRARAMAASGFEVNGACSAALNAELNAIAEGDWLRRCARVTAPVLVIQGDRDPRPLQAVDSMLAMLPRNRRVVLTGAAHYPWVERPEEFMTEIDRWLLEASRVHS